MIKKSDIANDFNIAYATAEGLKFDDELDGWEFRISMNHSESYQTDNAENKNKRLTDSGFKAKITNLNECKLSPQNLYVTVLRTKNSTIPSMSSESRLL